MTTLRCAVALAIQLVLSAAAHAHSNFAECILEMAPSVKNAPAFGAVHRSCLAKYPEMYYDIKQGSGIGIFGPKDADACTIKYAENTTLQQAAAAIGRACACLYRKPFLKGDMCDYREGPWEAFK